MPKFEDYPEVAPLDGSEILVVKQGPTTKRTTAGAIAGLVTLPEDHFSGDDPTPEDGDDGDKWYNTNTWDVLRKESGTWVFKGNTKGEDGDDGAPGEDSTVEGPPGPPGALFLGVTRWENDDTRVGGNFVKPGLYRLKTLADPEADPPVVEEWEFLRPAAARIPYRDDFEPTVSITAADLDGIVFIYAAPPNNAEVVVNVPGGLWAGPDLAPIWVQIGTQNPVRFQAPTGVNFRLPANGQVSNSFTVAGGSRWKWVNILTLANLHRVM